MVYRTLIDIKRVVNNQAVETLTQYRYDEHGQLTAVINRNGDTVRSFSYAEGLMVTHSNALGLGCHYRWETLGDKPPVVEHWNSDGEHFHFRYDLDARTSWATDVLGRELEVQYNADQRVVASRDYGSERYAIPVSLVGAGINGQVAQKRFLWQGLRMLREAPVRDLEVQHNADHRVLAR